MNSRVGKGNPIENRRIWQEQRDAAAADPGRFHGEIAKRQIFWFEASLGAWIRREEGECSWTGFDARSGRRLESVPLAAEHNPWTTSFSDRDYPFYRWFEGGLTNACFNEVDAHVLAGYGAEIALIYEGERWDSALNGGKGGPVTVRKVSRRELFLETARHALVLRGLGLKKGDRLAINMPNTLDQIFYIEAAKRLGVIYTCIFGGFSPKTLADRIEDSGARVVITTDGAVRNGQSIGYKREFTDEALSNYVRASQALSVLDHVISTCPELRPGQMAAIRASVSRSVEGEITVARDGVLEAFERGMGLAGLADGTEAVAAQAVRRAFALAMAGEKLAVEKVIVVRHTGEADLPWDESRDFWSHELLVGAEGALLKEGVHGRFSDLLLQGTDEELIRAVYGCIPPVAVESEFPIFICYTSGSTGKPKGIVHVHGAYVAGIAHTMQLAFGVEPGGVDVIYVVADPGWITGQSYMICAALVTRTTSVIAECAPIFPHAGRFASIIERHQVTVFKAGTTFLRAAASDPANLREIQRYDRGTLKVATFCAEPVSPAIQEFGMAHVTSRYINSYWATEHGGIVLTHFHGSTGFALQADAHAYALPWIFTDVWVAVEGGETDESRGRPYRSAAYGEKGDLVITRPYPALARTIWGDGERVTNPGWKGDITRFSNTYFERWAKPGKAGASLERAFTQGDYACRYEDGSLTLHGRSDEVIKVAGHRIGTEEIEGAILRDKLGSRMSPVGNVIVVGAPHLEQGAVPVAFVTTKEGAALSAEDIERLSALVRAEKGESAVPAGYIAVRQFPETRSGKYLRRFLKAMLWNEPAGDTSSLRNPESLKEITVAIEAWKMERDERSSLGAASEGPGGELARLVSAAEGVAWKEQALLTHLKKLLARVLSAEGNRTIDASEIGIDKPLRSLGLTSLKSLAFSGLVKTAVGPRLADSFPVTAIFNYPTLSAIADYLARDVFAFKSARNSLPKTREASDSEPIAVVGMACRFPGDVNSPQEFWDLLHQGRSGISGIPPERWKVEEHFSADRDAPGKMYVRSGGFVSRIDQFDPQFFGISNLEAIALDPQHRLLLEVAWEALERGGIRPDSLAGTRTGVFVGITTKEYAELLRDSPDKAKAEMYIPTGNNLNTASGRLAYVLGTRGPCLSVDTACSSSLVAIHLACQSIRAGESDTVIAGGVNLMVTPDFTAALCKTNALSPEGLCRTFDEAADGYVRSDGCGMVVLKRLSRALADGDIISAVILGSAVNHDGMSNGLTAPNGVAQEELLREALASSRVSPAEVTHLETHGTGTPLGDPVEAQAIASVFREGRIPDNPLYLGAVKSNIGHTESAAGVAGFIKMVLCLKHAEIPPVLHFRKLNPQISLEQVPAAVPTALVPWKSGGQRRIGGVSAFGFSGTNAHVVLTEAPARRENRASAPDTCERTVHVLALTAKSKPALLDLARSYDAFFSAHPLVSLGEVCHTAISGRNHFEERLAISGRSVAELRNRLAEFQKGRVGSGVFHGNAPDGKVIRTAFLFSGQGSQFHGMGRELYETQPDFREALDRCEEILRGLMAPSLKEILFGDDEALIDQTEFTQPALFSFEYALHELWRAWGLEPSAVLGHSVGEYVAACVAGVFSLEDGLKLTSHRARLMQKVDGSGAMGALAVSEAVALAAIEKLGADKARVSVAAINGPESVVIAGESKLVSRILDEFENSGVRVNRLRVSHAFHSAQMDQMLDEFERIASEVRYSRPRIPMISNLTGTWVAEAEVCNASYWRKHARGAVRFAAGVKALFGDGIRTFLEVGPGTTLCGMGQLSEPRGERGDIISWNSSLRKDRRDWDQLADTVAYLFSRGLPVDWRAWEAGAPQRRRIELPTYPFQRQRHWMEAPRAVEPTGRGERIQATAHSVLGREFEVSTTGDFIYEFEHAAPTGGLAGVKTSIPPSELLTRVSLAAVRLSGESPIALEVLTVGEPMILDAGETRISQLLLSPASGNSHAFRIVSRRTMPVRGDWVTHATGRVVLQAKTEVPKESRPLQQPQAATVVALRATPEPPESKGVAAVDGASPGIVASLDRETPEKRRELLTEFLRGEIERAMSMTPGSLADGEKNLMKLGMDSMLAVRIRNNLILAIGSQFEALVPLTVVFRNPTLHALAKFLDTKIFSEKERTKRAA